jgi:hypothetical protein
MDAESRRIWEMFGRLSDAFWRRATQPGVSALDVLLAEEQGPVSEEEKAIWAEITAPHNYAPLRRYIEGWQKAGMNAHAARLYEMLLAEATRRWETEFGCGNTDHSPGLLR